jgi:hypothetical protein
LLLGEGALNVYQPYLDLLLRLGAPLWWDENGVPRYEPFKPELTANIYAEFRCLIEIRCQGCQRVFPVASVWSVMDIIAHGWEENDSWKEQIAYDENGQNPRPVHMPVAGNAGFCFYGDAPWHDYDGGFEGQCSGTTMTTSVVRILEFWKRKDSFEWERDAAHEVYIVEE